MPFQADTRWPFVSIKLNVSTVCEEIENLIDKDYTEEIYEGSAFWGYVEILESEFSSQYSRNTKLDFWEWLPDNYDSEYIWADIENNFKDREEDTSDDEEESCVVCNGSELSHWEDRWYAACMDCGREFSHDEDYTFNVEEYLKNKN